MAYETDVGDQSYIFRVTPEQSQAYTSGLL